MGVFRKFIFRQPWWLIILVGILQVQITQAFACDLMMVVPETTGEVCNKHLPDAQQGNTHDNTCCDMEGFIMDYGYCNNDNVAINPSTSEKLNPEIVYALLAYAVHDQLISNIPAYITASPTRHSTVPGNYTYLTTQRLRI